MGVKRVALLLIVTTGLAACGSDRALEEQRRSFEGQIGELQTRVSSLEAERENLQTTLSTSLEEEYRFVSAQLTDLQAQVRALEVRRENLRAALEAEGIVVPETETGGQTGGEAAALELLERALSGGNTGGAPPAGTGGLLTPTGGASGGTD